MANANDFGPGVLLYPSATSMGWIHGASVSNPTIDAAGESVHFIGTCFIDGRAASKTISAAGGGSISWLPGTATFANAGTTLRVGIQDVDATAAAPIRGDGTFDVYADLVGGTDTITASTWRTDAMEVGTKTISHGQLIAIAFNLEARAGADALQIRCMASNHVQHFPAVTLEAPDATFTIQAALPNGIITFDDGTLGWIMGAFVFSAGPTTTSYDSASTTDEYATIFQFPRPTAIDGLLAYMTLEITAGTTEWILYSDPEGTPAAVAGGTITLDHDQRGGTVNRLIQANLGAVIELSANTKYAVALRPVGAENITILWHDVATAAHLKSAPGGTQSYIGSRANQTGAFATTTTRRLWTGVVACGGDDGAGAGGGEGPLIGGRLVL